MPVTRATLEISTVGRSGVLEVGLASGRRAGDSAEPELAGAGRSARDVEGAPPAHGSRRARLGEADLRDEGGNDQLIVTDEALTVVRWSALLGAVSTVGSPNFDCNRTGPGGVLYVASTNRHLQAILVDSPRLAATDWPKWQHDSQNSGNPDFPLNAGCP